MIKPYYTDDYCTIYNADCRDVLSELPPIDLVLSDPPYGRSFSFYHEYEDVEGIAYLDLIRIFKPYPLCLLQYPEEAMKYFVPVFGPPDEVFLWVYNSNTWRQSRMFLFWGVKVDFTKQKIKTKNPEDKRCNPYVRSYDWTDQYQQVKNVSAEKTDHPCQVPEGLMRMVLSFTDTRMILDPFAGSGTTLRAAKDLGRKSIGIEISERYAEIAAERMRQEVFSL